MKYATFPKATRVTIVTDEGLVFEDYDLYKGGVELHLQDGGHTLKLFPRQAEEVQEDQENLVTLSWKTGGLLGALMKAGLHAAPIESGRVTRT